MGRVPFQRSLPDVIAAPQTQYEVYEPTLAEIASACEGIRSEWSPRELERRRIDTRWRTWTVQTARAPTALDRDSA